MIAEGPIKIRWERRIVAFILLIVAAATGGLRAEVVDSEMLLLPFDHHLNQAFGYSVAISGGTAVVGAPEDALRVGSAYVYNKVGTNWVFRQKLIPIEGGTNDLIGISVAIDSDLLAIGAPGFNPGFTNSVANQGYAYIFQRNTNGDWVQQARLFAPDAQRDDRFGVSVALSGQSVVIGSSFHDDFGNTNNGSIYAFDLTGSGWQLTAKITPDDLTNNSFFGQRVAMSGNTIIACASSSLVPVGNFFLTSPGAAYVYTRTNVTPYYFPWNLQQKLLPGNFTNSGQFGYSVALDGDTALVGAPFTSEGGTVFSFIRNGNVWTNQTQLVPGDRTNGDNFGSSIALQGTRAVIGAVGKDSNNITGLGAAYVFTQTNALFGTNFFAFTNAFAQTNTFADTNVFAPTNALVQTDAFANTNIFAPTNVFPPANAIVATNELGETNLSAQVNVGWTEQEELRPLQASDNFEFGFSVAIGNQGVLVGAPAAPIGRGTGAAYVFGSSESIGSIVSATASPSILTPPNRLLVPVTIIVVTTGSNVISKIVSVTSNQADVGVGMNADAPDSIITGDLTVLLRAELPDNVNVDRVYSVLIESVDRFGNIAMTSVPVVVPHTLGPVPAVSGFAPGTAIATDSIINFGTIHSGIITPGSINTGAEINAASPFTTELAEP